jgi:hypothetical protein
MPGSAVCSSETGLIDQTLLIHGAPGQAGANAFDIVAHVHRGFTEGLPLPQALQVIRLDHSA